MRRAWVRAACLGVVTAVVGLFVVTRAAGRLPDDGGPDIGWADLRSDVETLAEAAEARTTASFTPAPGAASRGAARSPAQVVEILGRLDGADDVGAAASAWRDLFGAGAAVMAIGAGGGPVASARFVDAATAARFVHRRLARARAAVQGRRGSVAGGAVLHRRLELATSALEQPRRTRFAPGMALPCGPVRVEASGDTTALGDLCADLDAYWAPGSGTPSPGSPTDAVVRVVPLRPGAVPEGERWFTTAASVVDAATSEVEAMAAVSTQAAAPAPKREPVGPQGPSTEMNREPRRQGHGSGEPRSRAAPGPPSSPQDPPASSHLGRTEAKPETDVVPIQASGSPPPPQPAAVEASGSRERPDALAPVLAAARMPANWVPAAGGGVALVAGIALAHRAFETRRHLAGRTVRS